MLIALVLWVVSLFSSRAVAVEHVAVESPERQLVRAGYSLRQAERIGLVVQRQRAAFADDAELPGRVVAAFVHLRGHERATAQDLESFRVAGFRSECLLSHFWANGGDADADTNIREAREALDAGEVRSSDFALVAVDVGEAFFGADCRRP